MPIALVFLHQALNRTQRSASFLERKLGKELQFAAACCASRNLPIEPSEAPAFLKESWAKPFQFFRSHHGPEKFILFQSVSAETSNRTQRSELKFFLPTFSFKKK
jgi:hypothetical protein